MSQSTRVVLGKDSSGREIILNRRTVSMIREAERRLRKPLTIVQGGFVNGRGAVASAGTHDGPAVDFRTWDLHAKGMTVDEVVTVLRKVGFAAWHRTTAQGFDDHIHAIPLGDPELSPAAKAQAWDYRHRRNGLAKHGPDDGPRVAIRTWGLVRRIVKVRMAQRDLDAWRKAHTADGGK